MPMHPSLDRYELAVLVELADPQQRQRALNKLVEEGFVNQQSAGRWIEELNKPEYGANRVSDFYDNLKIVLDKRAAEAGKLSSTQAMAVLRNLLQLMDAAREPTGYQHNLESIRNQSVLDFGSGIFYPFCASALLYANGYSRAVAFEPFEINVDYAVGSLFELVRSAFDDPGKFCFSGIDGEGFKVNLARLNLENLRERLEAFNGGELDTVSIGGVSLVKSVDQLAEKSLNVIFSNSVMEHVEDLGFELSRQRRLLVDSGVCFHTMDFVDHRYYFDNSINPFEMYYDGVLDDINGLRPSQVERISAESGFVGIKLRKMALPEAYIDRRREMKAPYAGMSPDDLFEWLNGYILVNKR